MILALAQLALDRVRGNWARAQEFAVRRGIHIASRPPTGYSIAEVYRRRAAGASWTELALILEHAGAVGRLATRHGRRAPCGTWSSIPCTPARHGPDGITRTEHTPPRCITTRARMLWAGEARADLPARGRRMPLPSFDWP